ncbi:unnamed protein product [Closterium sp. Yama58-4]|nr:unnamed protein product [Closterium sp. Yama58-4]
MASTARQSGPLWNATEDVILLTHVARHGTSQWGVLQASGLLPRRDNKACCNRFIVLKRNYQQNRIKNSQVVKALLVALRSNNHVKSLPEQSRAYALRADASKKPITSTISAAEHGTTASSREPAPAPAAPTPPEAAAAAPALAPAPAEKQPSPSITSHDFSRTATEVNTDERRGEANGTLHCSRTSISHTEDTIPRSTRDACEETARYEGENVDNSVMDHLSLASRINQSPARSNEFLACLLQAAAAAPAAPVPTASASESTVPEASAGGGALARGTLKRQCSGLWEGIEEHTLVSSKRIKSLPEFWQENEDHAVLVAAKAKAYKASDAGMVTVETAEPTLWRGSLLLGADSLSPWIPYAGLPWCEGGCQHNCQSCQATQPNLAGLRPDALLDALSSGPLSMVLFGF